MLKCHDCAKRHKVMLVKLAEARSKCVGVGNLSWSALLTHVKEIDRLAMECEGLIHELGPQMVNNIIAELGEQV